MNEKLCNNIIDIIIKKPGIASTTCEQGCTNLNGVITLIRRILQCIDDDFENDFCLLVISGLFSSC